MKITLLLALSVILLLSLIANVFLIIQLNSLNLENGIIQKQVNDLKTATAELQSEKETLNNQFQTQNKAFSPKLVTQLGAKDIRKSPYPNHPWSGIIRFYIAGEVWNVGQVSAFNSKLHVVLYQGTTVANDTYVQLGTIKPGSFLQVKADIFYEGDALTSWNIIPETD